MNLGARWNFDLSKEILKYAFNFYIVGILGNINRLTTKTIAAFFNPSQLASITKENLPDLSMSFQTL